MDPTLQRLKKNKKGKQDYTFRRLEKNIAYMTFSQVIKARIALLPWVTRNQGPVVEDRKNACLLDKGGSMVERMGIATGEAFIALILMAKARGANSAAWEVV